jgi:PhzF family phenazine biosynthesis protein
VSRAVEVFLVDAFTDRPFAGNPAGVVPDARGLDADTMRAIGVELARPATAFVSDGGLQWFTPSGAELTFCGHGTIAAVQALAQTGRLAGPSIAFETRAGRLQVTVEPPRVWIEAALRAWREYGEPLGPVLGALGLAPAALASWAPPALTTEADLVLPVRGLHELKALAPDPERLGALGRERGLRGIAVTSRETVEPEALIHTRFFAPHLGIPEDAASGSLHVALAVWLHAAGLLPAGGERVAFRAEQGDFLGRPSRLAVEVYLAGGRPARVRVGGQAVTVMTGTLTLP